MKIKAVIFDLDDTLYDEKQFVKSGFRAASRYVQEKRGIDQEKLYQLLLKTFLEHGRKNVFNLALKKLNIYDEDLVMEMVKTYRNHSPNITVSKADLNILSEIKRRYLVGLLTDGVKEVQKNKVEALRLEGHFDAVTYAYEHGGKNNLQAFLTIIDKLKVKASESVFVDDNPLKGFAVAKRLGIHTIRILRGEKANLKVEDKKNEPEFEITNLDQLFDVIQSIQVSPGKTRSCEKVKNPPYKRK